MNIKIIVLLILMLSGVASAGQFDLSIGVPGTTDHRPGACNTLCNEDTDLAVIGYTGDSGWGGSFASFVNSYANHTYALVGTYTWRVEPRGPIHAVEVQPALGFIKGYQRDHLGMSDWQCPAADICPGGMVSTSIMITKNIGVHYLTNWVVDTWAIKFRFDLRGVK